MPVETQYEAMAATVNGRGTPYLLGDLVFPPGAWVDVTPAQAARLKWLGWAEVREKASA